MKLSIFLATLALLLASGVAAIQQITIEQGDSVRITDTILSADPITSLESTYWIPGTDFERTFHAGRVRSNFITHTFAIDVPQDDYVLIVEHTINEGVTKRTEFLLTVLAATTPRTAPRTTPAVTIAIDPRTADEPATVTIPPIPDINPGETIVLPVTITGTGTYTISIPKLTFATYEAPLTVLVDGQRTVPVLVRIDHNARPGTYLIPVNVNDEEVSARIRIITYRTSIPWALITAGLLLVVIGAAIIILAAARPPRSGVNPPKEPDLITYY